MGLKVEISSTGKNMRQINLRESPLRNAQEKKLSWKYKSNICQSYSYIFYATSFQLWIGPSDKELEHLKHVV